MKKIKKKCLPEYYQEVRKRKKTFEIRKDDSDYEVGDILELHEWNRDSMSYTGHKITREITYILRDAQEYGLMPGYCILAIQPIGWNEEYYVAQQANFIQNGENNQQIINNGSVVMKWGGKHDSN
jgi:hypothetical protein